MRTRFFSFFNEQFVFYRSFVYNLVSGRGFGSRTWVDDPTAGGSGGLSADWRNITCLNMNN